MAQEKTANYTEEMTNTVKALYANGTSTEAIAATVGKSVRSVVAKLTREGVYKRKEYVSKTGAMPVSKESLVQQIANIMGCAADDLPGLEKSNKTTLDKLLKFAAGIQE